MAVLYLDIVNKLEFAVEKKNMKAMFNYLITFLQNKEMKWKICENFALQI